MLQHNPDDLIKLSDGAAMLGEPYRRFYDRAMSGELELVRSPTGRGWRVTKRSVARLIANLQQPEAAR